MEKRKCNKGRGGKEKELNVSGSTINNILKPKKCHNPPQLASYSRKRFDDRMPRLGYSSSGATIYYTPRKTKPVNPEPGMLALDCTLGVHGKSSTLHRRGGKGTRYKNNVGVDTTGLISDVRVHAANADTPSKLHNSSNVKRDVLNLADINKIANHSEGHTRGLLPSIRDKCNNLVCRDIEVDNLSGNRETHPFDDRNASLSLPKIHGKESLVCQTRNVLDKVNVSPSKTNLRTESHCLPFTRCKHSSVQKSKSINCTLPPIRTEQNKCRNSASIDCYLPSLEQTTVNLDNIASIGANREIHSANSKVLGSGLEESITYDKTKSEEHVDRQLPVQNLTTHYSYPESSESKGVAGECLVAIVKPTISDICLRSKQDPSSRQVTTMLPDESLNTYEHMQVDRGLDFFHNVDKNILINKIVEETNTSKSNEVLSMPMESSSEESITTTTDKCASQRLGCCDLAMIKKSDHNLPILKTYENELRAPPVSEHKVCTMPVVPKESESGITYKDTKNLHLLQKDNIEKRMVEDLLQQDDNDNQFEEDLLQEGNRDQLAIEVVLHKDNTDQQAIEDLLQGDSVDKHAIDEDLLQEDTIDEHVLEEDLSQKGNIGKHATDVLQQGNNEKPATVELVQIDNNHHVTGENGNLLTAEHCETEILEKECELLVADNGEVNSRVYLPENDSLSHNMEDVTESADTAGCCGDEENGKRDGVCRLSCGPPPQWPLLENVEIEYEEMQYGEQLSSTRQSEELIPEDFIGESTGLDDQQNKTQPFYEKTVTLDNNCSLVYSEYARETIAAIIDNATRKLMIMSLQHELEYRKANIVLPSTCVSKMTHTYSTGLKQNTHIVPPTLQPYMYEQRQEFTSPEPMLAYPQSIPSLEMPVLSNCYVHTSALNMRNNFDEKIVFHKAQVNLLPINGTMPPMSHSMFARHTNFYLCGHVPILRLDRSLPCVYVDGAIMAHLDHRGMSHVHHRCSNIANLTVQSNFVFRRCPELVNMIVKNIPNCAYIYCSVPMLKKREEFAVLPFVREKSKSALYCLMEIRNYIYKQNSRNRALNATHNISKIKALADVISKTYSNEEHNHISNDIPVVSYRNSILQENQVTKSHEQLRIVEVPKFQAIYASNDLKESSTKNTVIKPDVEENKLETVSTITSDSDSDLFDDIMNISLNASSSATDTYDEDTHSTLSDKYQSLTKPSEIIGETSPANTSRNEVESLQKHIKDLNEHLSTYLTKHTKTTCNASVQAQPSLASSSTHAGSSSLTIGMGDESLHYDQAVLSLDTDFARRLSSTYREDVPDMEAVKMLLDEHYRSREQLKEQMTNRKREMSEQIKIRVASIKQNKENTSEVNDEEVDMLNAFSKDCEAMDTHLMRMIRRREPWNNMTAEEIESLLSTHFNDVEKLRQARQHDLHQLQCKLQAKLLSKSDHQDTCSSASSRMGDEWPSFVCDDESSRTFRLERVPTTAAEVEAVLRSHRADRRQLLEARVAAARVHRHRLQDRLRTATAKAELNVRPTTAVRRLSAIEVISQHRTQVEEMRQKKEERDREHHDKLQQRLANKLYRVRTGKRRPKSKYTPP